MNTKEKLESLGYTFRLTLNQDGSCNGMGFYTPPPYVLFYETPPYVGKSLEAIQDEIVQMAFEYHHWVKKGRQAHKAKFKEGDTVNLVSDPNESYTVSKVGFAYGEYMFELSGIRGWWRDNQIKIESKRLDGTKAEILAFLQSAPDSIVYSLFWKEKR